MQGIPPFHRRRNTAALLQPEHAATTAALRAAFARSNDALDLDAFEHVVTVGRRTCRGASLARSGPGCRCTGPARCLPPVWMT